MEQNNDHTAFERQITEKIGAAKFRLRFDKVATRLVRTLQDALEPVVEDGEALLFTCTAPIKQPGQTAETMESLARGVPPKQGIGDTVHGNEVRLRRITGVPAGRPKILGFVHNPDMNAIEILNLAELGLR
jgi:hypothetical protein